MENKKEMLTDEMNISMFSEYDDIVSIEDVMGMLHIGKFAVYSLLKSKTIRCVRVGRKYIIPQKSVIKFIEENVN